MKTYEIKTEKLWSKQKLQQLQMNNKDVSATDDRTYSDLEIEKQYRFYIILEDKDIWILLKDAKTFYMHGKLKSAINDIFEYELHDFFGGRFILYNVDEFELTLYDKDTITNSIKGHIIQYPDINTDYKNCCKCSS